MSRGMGGMRRGFGRCLGMLSFSIARPPCFLGLSLVIDVLIDLFFVVGCGVVVRIQMRPLRLPRHVHRRMVLHRRTDPF